MDAISTVEIGPPSASGPMAKEWIRTPAARTALVQALPRATKETLVTLVNAVGDLDALPAPVRAEVERLKQEMEFDYLETDDDIDNLFSD